MKIVIDIPEGLKKSFELEQWTALSCMEMKDALMNGTPLPKGHGRLIDADMVLAEIDELRGSPWYNENINGSYAVRKDAVGIVEDLCVKKAPTIIDKENEK